MDNAGIKTWRERIGAGPDFPLHAPTDVERAMVAEIAELRALLQAERASQPEGASANLSMRADLAEEVLATVLWLYRRLASGYGRPPTVERPILALAKLTGIDVVDCLAERGQVHSATTEYQGMERNK